MTKVSLITSLLLLVSKTSCWVITLSHIIHMLVLVRIVILPSSIRASGSCRIKLSYISPFVPPIHPPPHSTFKMSERFHKFRVSRNIGTHVHKELALKTLVWHYSKNTGFVSPAEFRFRVYQDPHRFLYHI